MYILIGSTLVMPSQRKARRAETMRPNVHPIDALLVPPPKVAMTTTMTTMI
ncbi:hypothetical protein CJF31_00000071 [Rutstroemia sp. NJR-2017a BVV2]|nr:hypothetical protein CJF31_00000071 [Rutstroemia sp. NJR-2017a BVV2]